MSIILKAIYDHSNSHILKPLHVNKPLLITKKYLLVAVKVDNGEDFILTSFFTDKIKAGESLWEK